MSGKQTAVILQLSGDPARDHEGYRQQLIIFPGKVVFRRNLTPDHRPRWRPSHVTDPAEWVQHSANLTAIAEVPLTLSHGPVLIEVTDDELTAAQADDFQRNVGLRYARVKDAMDDAGEAPTTAQDGIDQFITDWLTAMDDSNDTWLDEHLHPQGSAKDPAPAAATPTAVVIEPEPVTAATPAGLVWTYPEVDASGYVTRPNGERYKTRFIEGVRDVQMIRDSRAWGEHVLLTGVPGTGKTALLEAAFGDDMVNMLGTEDTEVPDFIGSYVTRGTTPKGDVLYGWADAALSEAIERDVPLYVDECGVIMVKVLTVLYSMMDGRKRYKVLTNPDRGELVAGPGFIVVAATNPKAPGVRFSEALTSRFDLQVEVTTDFSMLRELGVPDELVTAGENLETKRLTDVIQWSPQARELLQAARQWDRRGPDFAVRNLMGKCPEHEREEVAETLKSVTGRELTPLSL
jgi:hypothetical protein